MKILIIEQPLNDRGDESAHRGLVNKLIQEYPDANIKVLFYGQKDKDVEIFRVESPQIEYVNIHLGKTRHKYNVRIIKILMMLRLPRLLYLIPKMRRVINGYKHTDFVLCAPGGMNLGGFRDWIHQAFLLLAKYEHKKVIYWGRSIGPFSDVTYLDKLFRRRSIKLLNYFSFTSLRDYKSQTIAKQLNVNYVPTIDSAFLREIPYEVPKAFIDEIKSISYIVLVPNSLAWHRNFKNYTFEDIKRFWIEMVNGLSKSYPNSKIVMLPQTIGYSKFLPDGYIYFNKIKNESNCRNQIIVLDEKYGCDIQQSIISKAQFLIGARYHSIIFAINQGVPFISLSYEHKMNGVIDLLKRNDCEVDLTKLLNGTPMQSIISDGSINKIIDMTYGLTPDIETSKKAKKIATQGFDQLRSFLDSQYNLI